jgi:hypothetical protein
MPVYTKFTYNFPCDDNVRCPMTLVSAAKQYILPIDNYLFIKHSISPYTSNCGMVSLLRQKNLGS